MFTIRVSELVSRINAFLHRSVNLSEALIAGELSNVRYVNGHCYFDLKDENGQLSCTLWRSHAARAGFRLEDGLAVLVHGSLNLYEKRGSLQLSVDSIEPAGVGALHIQLEQTRKALMEQGYFDAAHKQPKPAEIRKIGLVTGASTAALQDVMKTIRTRWPMLEVHLFEAPVQGSEAPPKIVKALRQADAAGMDAVLLVRGGGSFEDLFCFNDPEIVKTLYAMKTYTVTGIGHEVDTSLADLAADHRALTPTAAAQWVTPDQNEVRQRLARLSLSLEEGIRLCFERNAQKLLYLQATPVLASPESWIESRQSRTALLMQRLMQLSQARFHGLQMHLRALDTHMEGGLAARFDQAGRRQQLLNASLLLHSPAGTMQKEQARLESLDRQLSERMAGRIQTARARLEKDSSLLEALSPQRILDQGYSIVSFNGHAVRDAASLSCGSEVSIRFACGRAVASIEQIEPSQK